MRIGELSRRTGVSVPTIKFYVREGLLPAGRLTSPNQAAYEETHVRRLRLIRALIDVGGMSVAAVGEVIAAIDDPGRPVHELLGEAAHRMVPRYGDGSPGGDEGEDAGPGSAEARKRVGTLLDERGWHGYPESPAGQALAVALTALESVGHGRFAEVLDVYADAAERVARVDLEYVAHHVAREELVESVAVGTALGDAVFAALRRLAHTDASYRLFGREGEGEGEDEGETERAEGA
ncbi:MerR family transcriptional regulator [Streptomyces filamentosus]|uniref:MerR family transcriptional regulator n=1 Tax=Streptomyces filamentosus TaxID=67294 RepID=UPI001239FEA2|nr:MerR family transcriptional regulator [Streptomyces filamentosus]KAA6216774.1 MerR family transcriptional regulator [Streptomyces filamentosus]